MTDKRAMYAAGATEHDRSEGELERDELLGRIPDYALWLEAKKAAVREAK